MENTHHQTALPSPIGVIKQSFSLYKANLGMILLIGLVPSVFSILGYIIDADAFPLASTILAIAWGISSYLAFIAILLLVVTHSTKMTLAEAYKRSLSYVFPLLWITILSSLVILAGVPLLIIPAIYLGGLLSFAAYALVAEEKRGLSALAQSWHYVRGKWWALFYRSILLYVILGVVTIAISSILGTGSNEDILAQDLVGAFFFGPISTILMWILYKAFKAHTPAISSNDLQIVLIRERLITLSWVGVFVWVMIAAVFAYFGMMAAVDAVAM